MQSFLETRPIHIIHTRRRSHLPDSRTVIELTHTLVTSRFKNPYAADTKEDRLPDDRIPSSSVSQQTPPIHRLNMSEGLDQKGAELCSTLIFSKAGPELTTVLQYCLWPEDSQLSVKPLHRLRQMHSPKRQMFPIELRAYRSSRFARISAALKGWKGGIG